MPLVDHLGELRTRLIRSLVAIAMGHCRRLLGVITPSSATRETIVIPLTVELDLPGQYRVDVSIDGMPAAQVDILAGYAGPNT